MPKYLLPAAAASAMLATPLAAQSPLPLDGESMTGEITRESPVISENVQYTDLYTVAGEAGERIAIDLISDDFDAFLEIGRMEGDRFVSLRSDDDSGGDLNSRLVFTLPESGEYVVRARPLGPDTVGTYLIEANRLGPPAPPPDPIPIAAGSETAGEFTLDSPTYSANDYGPDRHYALYSLSGDQGDSYTVTLRSDDFDAYLEAGGMTPVGFGMVTSNDDGDFSGPDEEPSLDSRLTVTFLQSGTVTLRATTLQGGNLGTYRIIVD